MPLRFRSSCALAFDIGQPFLVAEAWQQGAGSSRTTRCPIPNDARLIGLVFVFQILNVDAAVPEGISWSNGVGCAVGR